jgi:hypothetical protein
MVKRGRRKRGNKKERKRTRGQEDKRTRRAAVAVTRARTIRESERESGGVSCTSRSTSRRSRAAQSRAEQRRAALPLIDERNEMD